MQDVSLYVHHNASEKSNWQKHLQIAVLLNILFKTDGTWEFNYDGLLTFQSYTKNNILPGDYVKSKTHNILRSVQHSILKCK